MNVETRLKEMGVALPTPPAAIGNFVPAVVFDKILYVSGTYGTVKDADGNDYIPKPGQLGDELTVDDGYESARQMALNHLAMARAIVGDLSAIARPIRLLGFVNAVPGFKDAPAVLNGASDFLIELFGKEMGSHARMALYQPGLPRDAPIAGEIMFGLNVTELNTPT